MRIAVGLGVLGVLSHTFAAAGTSVLDYLGYFTNQTSLLMSLVLVAQGALLLVRRRSPLDLVHVRAVGTACLVVVASVYNTLVPGTGAAPPWVSLILHAVFPTVVVLDWILVGDREPLRWRSLWLVLPYPLLWLIVVLVRGVTDGWVPYGFLLPEHGPASLGLHVAGLLAALVAAGALVWAGSRIRPLLCGPGPRGEADAHLSGGTG